MSDFERSAALIEAATDAFALFGSADEADAQRVYRELARVVHPDAVGRADKARAGSVFSRLTQFRQQLNEPLTRCPGRNRIAVGSLLARGDISNIYAADIERAHVRGAWKVARHPRDNDLLDTEARVLRSLAAGADPRYAAYVPRLVDAVVHRDSTTGAERHGTLLERLDGFVSLAQLGTGWVDPRDAAWIWRRLLVAIGFAHRNGFIHGAILPEHVLIEPVLHGLVLIDWCYAVEDGDRICAMVPARETFYPSEVRAKQAAVAATDIYMATRVLTHLLGTGMPPAMRAFADGCCSTNPAARPDDAWALKDEFDGLLERLYGERRFRAFPLPAGIRRTGTPAGDACQTKER